MKHVKKRGRCFLLAAALLMAVMPVHVQAAATKLNKAKVTVTEGQTVQLSLKNAPKGKTIKWSSNKKSVATVTQKGKVKAKKAGTAKITAAVAKKKYTCKVTVEKQQDIFTNTEGKNAADVKALTSIAQEQMALGAKIPVNLDDDDIYSWDENGRLTWMEWEFCSLKGSLSLKGLSSLQSLYLSENELSSLDLSNNTALKSLYCSNNQLSSLDVSRNTALEDLYCYNNRLSSLDLSNNTSLSDLECDEGVVVTGYRR